MKIAQCPKKNVSSIYLLSHTERSITDPPNAHLSVLQDENIHLVTINNISLKMEELIWNIS